VRGFERGFAIGFLLRNRALDGRLHLFESQAPDFEKVQCTWDSHWLTIFVMTRGMMIFENWL